MRTFEERLRLTGASLTAAAATLLAAAASAQIAPSDTDLLDAEVIDINEQSRALTVRFEENGAVETYPVATDAEFFVWDGVMERPRDFDDIAIGTEISLEFSGIEGEQTLSKVVARDDGN